MEKETSAKGKIQEICDILKQETIDPARQEANEILENAHMQAQEIIKAAEQKANDLESQAKKAMEEEKRTFEANLHLASKQTLETLKQKIEQELFQHALGELLKNFSKDPELLARLINSIVNAIDKEGIDVDLSAYIPKQVPTKKVTEQLLDTVLERLRSNTVEIGEFEGGVKVKMHDREITIDISMHALKDLIGSFVRKEFREMIFNV